MNKHFNFWLIAAFTMTSSSLSAQWVSPTAPQQEYVSPTAPKKASLCNASFSIPEANIEVPITYQGTCPSGLAEGYQTVRELPDDQNQGNLVTITSTFVAGRPTGQTNISLPGIFFFDGQIENNIMRGKFTFTDFSSDGEYRNGQIYTGRIFRAKSMGGGVNHFVAGQLVSSENYNAATSTPDRYPPGSPEAALGYNSKGKSTYYNVQPSEAHIPNMTKLEIDGYKTCLADMPTKLFKINEVDVPGRCANGFYTGKANLVLTPLAGNTLPKMNVSLRYEAGQIVGPVKAKYPDYKMTYEGTFLDWEPQDGQTAQSVGNDNYSVIVFQNGQQTNQFTEYRQPSQETLMLRRLGRDLLNIGVDILVRCVSGNCPIKRKKRAPVYQPPIQNAPPVIASNQQEAFPPAEVNTESGIQQQAPALPNDTAQPVRVAVADVSVTTVEPTNQPTRAIDTVGNTNLPEFGGNTAPPAPEFRVDTSPPAPTVATNSSDFGVTTSPPLVTTRPPDLPAPHPAVQGLPDPVRGVEPLAPPVPAPVQGAPLPEPSTPPPLAPATRLPDSSPPPVVPPVQPPTQSDTLGTGPVPSNPAPQPAPTPTQVYEPTPPTQPAVDVSSRPAPTPANNTAVNLIATPSVPYGLAPSGSSSSPAIVTNPVILRWSAITGADNYDFGISSEASGYQLVVDQRLTDTVYSGSLSPGKYRWNLRACNSQGVCSAFASQQYFEIPGAANVQANTQSTLSAPTQLYPTNQGELAFPVPIEWNRIAGATSYKVAVRNVTENVIIENDTVTTSNTLTPRNQKAGHYYEWDVQACNPSGCSVRSRNAGFRTVGITLTATENCDASLTPNQQRTVDAYSSLPSATAAFRPTSTTICRWKREGKLEREIAIMQTEVERVAAENRRFWEISFSERHRAGVKSVMNSSQVNTALSKLAERGVIAISGNKIAEVYDLTLALSDILARYREEKASPNWENRLKIVNIISYGITDQYAMALQKRLGFPVRIPPSLIAELASISAGEYGTGFIQAR